MEMDAVTCSATNAVLLPILFSDEYTTYDHHKDKIVLECNPYGLRHTHKKLEEKQGWLYSSTVLTVTEPRTLDQTSIEAGLYLALTLWLYIIGLALLSASGVLRERRNTARFRGN